MEGQSSQERLEDVFQEEILRAFVRMDDFKMFARSKNGLCLDESDIQPFIENNPDSVTDQKMALLKKWREIKGEEATARKIRSLARGYMRGDNPDDYISLCKGMFGIFRNQPLSKCGHVFLGEQLSDLIKCRLRAIKFAPHDEEILREAQILTKLGAHVNIVTTIHADKYHAGPIKHIFIVMELFWGRSIRDVFKELTLDEHTAMDFAIQIINALSFIHAHSFLHRNLKPESISVSDDLKNLKLTDFGKSKAISDGYQTIQTNEETGTDGYRAQETYDDEKKISAKADMFSAGVTLAEIFSNGKHPYGDNPNLWRRNILNRIQPDLNQVFVPKKPQTQKLLGWMLQPEPGERPTAEEVQNDLKRLENTQVVNNLFAGDERQATSSLKFTSEISTSFARESQSDQPSTSSEFKTDHLTWGDRLEDVFQEILRAFVRMDDFKMFVRSNNGLCLDESVIQPIIENNPDSVVDQKMALLNKWSEIRGEEATARKILSLAIGYKRGDNPDDYISLCKGAFGIFRNERVSMSKHHHVFLGEQLSGLVERRLRAIKFVPYDEEILREAQIVTKLGTHENIVQTIHADTYYAGPVKYVFIVMELFWRRSIRHVFKELTLDRHTAMDFAIKIIKALAFIHKRNIVHRDLKPENLLVSDDLKHLKLADFGISREITDGYQTKQPNANKGTEGYRAQETYDEEISPKVDIFSAGVTLAEIFSNGKHPYGDNPHLLKSNIINRKEPDLNQVFVPEKTQTQKLLRWMLQPEPKERPTAEMVQNDLKRLENTQVINKQTAADKRQATSSLKFTSEIPTNSAQAGESQSDQPSTSRGYKNVEPTWEDRLEDVFQEEISRAFVRMVDFKMFARSKNGLCLDESDIQPIIENNPDSVTDQKMALLNKWREIKGEEATARKIRDLATGYKRGDNPDDYISLRKNMFGIFKNYLLSKRSHVFLGEQLSDLVGRRLRAIKIVPYNEENLREAQILIKLGTHENIVSTIHADTYHFGPFTYIFIVMELFFKTTLRDIFKKQKLDEHTAMDFANKIIKALAFIHGHNILHQDLEPENILVSEDLKQLKLSDFGISKKIMNDYASTEQYEDYRTQGYRAPETYDDFISTKADIFSAGVTLAEIFSYGKHPYGDDPDLWKHNIITSKKPDLSQVYVPKKPQTQELLSWMLQPKPEDRPTAEEVQNDLRQLENTEVVNKLVIKDHLHHH